MTLSPQESKAYTIIEAAIESFKHPQFRFFPIVYSGSGFIGIRVEMKCFYDLDKHLAGQPCLRPPNDTYTIMDDICLPLPMFRSTGHRDPKEYVISRMRQKAVELAVHECEEFITVDGKAKYDPHAESTEASE